MLIATHDTCLLHDTGEHPERIARLVAIRAHLEAARPADWAARKELPKARTADLARVHEEGMLALVAAAAAAGPALLDPDTIAMPKSWDAALAAAGQVIGCARAVARGEAKTAFAAVRPPGHHAMRAKPMGFCLANSIAAAARALQADGLGKIAILDFDVHHGNGTQDIFWEDASVFFCSLHRYPFYPGTGAADETGSGAGAGATRNFPLPFKTRPDAFLNTIAEACEALAAFRPEILLVSAGFDAYRRDPVGGLHLDVEHFERIGMAVRQTAESVCGGRVACALEGGYNLDALGPCCGAFLQGLEPVAPTC